MRSRLTARASALVAAALAIGAAGTASAQELSGSGYLFGAPRWNISVRGGYAGANAGSDVFQFVTSEMTLQKRDFGAFALGAEVAVALRPRLDFIFGFDAAGMEKRSEFREWEDNSGNPIEQSTAFSRSTWSVGARYYLLAQGRSLGRLAWVPARYAPWISVGAGRTLYSFGQDGDFIDFEKGNDVFHDTFESSQWTTTGEVAGGVDWSVNHRFALTTQLKYLFGKADLQPDYLGFDPIDLSGLGVSAGLRIRF